MAIDTTHSRIHLISDKIETIDRDVFKRFADQLAKADSVYVAGSRLAYTFIYYPVKKIMQCNTIKATLNRLIGIATCFVTCMTICND